MPLAPGYWFMWYIHQLKCCTTYFFGRQCHHVRGYSPKGDAALEKCTSVFVSLWSTPRCEVPYSSATASVASLWRSVCASTHSARMSLSCLGPRPTIWREQRSFSILLNQAFSGIDHVNTRSQLDHKASSRKLLKSHFCVTVHVGTRTTLHRTLAPSGFCKSAVSLLLIALQTITCSVLAVACGWQHRDPWLMKKLQRVKSPWVSTSAGTLFLDTDTSRKSMKHGLSH